MQPRPVHRQFEVCEQAIVDVIAGIPKASGLLLVVRFNPLNDGLERGVSGLNQHKSVSPGHWQGRNNGIGIHERTILLGVAFRDISLSVAIPTVVLSVVAKQGARRHLMLTCAKAGYSGISQMQSKH
ncbi:hypothetical protein X735_32600 [Mesorhizobium sp. L2C085B000]|nr:hypothetical protein X735_32600 [Mesorhizobium sp. L2C085B000]